MDTEGFGDLLTLLKIEELVRHQPHLKNIKAAVLVELKELDEEIGKDFQDKVPPVGPAQSGMPSSGPMSPNFVPAPATVKMPDAGNIVPVTSAPGGSVPATAPLGVQEVVPDSTPGQPAPYPDDTAAPFVAPEEEELALGAGSSPPLNRRV
jgi:hypothetical protein